MKQRKKIDRSKDTRRLVLVTVAVVIVFSFLTVYFSMNNEEQAQKKEQTITDDFGRTLLIPDNPQRIVSLAPSATEILFVLGLEGRIVGVDDNSDYPEAVKEIQKVGGWIPDLEKIVALKPDLVLVSDMTSVELIASLEGKGLTIVCLAPKTVYGVIQDINLVGQITGKPDVAEAVAEKLEQRIITITRVTRNTELYRPTVYLEYYPYWTFGLGSFGNDLISMAGGRNIAADAAAEYFNVSNEYIVGGNPEIIIFTLSQYTTTTVEDIRNRPGFNTIDAVKNNRIYTIDDNILSRPGPRIVDALEVLAHLIHPELFPQPQNEVRSWVC